MFPHSLPVVSRCLGLLCLSRLLRCWDARSYTKLHGVGQRLFQSSRQLTELRLHHTMIHVGVCLAILAKSAKHLLQHLDPVHRWFFCPGHLRPSSLLSHDLTHVTQPVITRVMRALPATVRICLQLNLSKNCTSQHYERFILGRLRQCHVHPFSMV